MKKNNKAYYKSEIGLIEVRGTKEGIISVGFVKEEKIDNFKNHHSLQKCIEQIDEYFKGKRTEFSLNLQLQGTVFQKSIWDQLTKIPFGQTLSYKAIAGLIGNERAVRAVGNTNRQNKIAIVIPCHRVIGNDGRLTGYAGGVWRKKWLLEHEGSVAAKKEAKQKHSNNDELHFVYIS